MKTIWSIGGHDPNAVAGIQADLLTAHSLGLRCRTILATFTAQNDHKVKLSEPVSLNWLEAQWSALLAEEQPGAIKLGLIQDSQHIQFLSDAFASIAQVPVVVDPVMSSSSGYRFVNEDVLTTWRELLAPRIQLLTPNLPEAEHLVGYKLETPAQIKQAAAELRSWGIHAVLIKGGHSQDSELSLDYFDDGQRALWLHGHRVARNFRGTGCSLATAIGAQLAKGLGLREAVVMGHAYLQQTLQDSFHQESPYLLHQPRSFVLPGLSYVYPSKSTRFPCIDDGRIGFYPIVPDLAWLKRILDWGIPSVQLRIKNLSGSALREAIFEAVRLCHNQSVRLFINDYWEIAAEAGAYGVHLGQEDLDALTSDSLQRLQKSGLRLGISTHSYEEASRAVALKPSYIALGPIFETTCKSMNFGPQGMEKLKEWSSLCGDVPLVAIGGLKLEHASPLLNYGASGLSVITDLLADTNPQSKARSWQDVFQKHPC